MKADGNGPSTEPIKEINPAAGTRFSYFPGCSLHATAREYDESLRAIAEPLGITLHEIEDWSCCGATPAHAIDPEAAEVLGLWNLSQASKSPENEVLTGCASCFSRLRATRDELHEHPDAAARALALVGREVRPELEVLHVAQVLARPEIRERLKAAVVKPFRSLPVACYYGCLLTRPRGATAVDDAEDPTLLEDLVRVVGAEAVPFPLRLDCCGASMAIPRPDLVVELSGKILEMAHARGAKAIIVACPLCHSNFDLKQAAIAKERKLGYRIPVLYLTQLIGLALGIEPARLGLQRHFVPVRASELMSYTPPETAGRTPSRAPAGTGGQASGSEEASRV